MSFAELSQRTRDLNTVRRLGQALWMLIGTPLQPAALLWSRATLGIDGDRVLWDGLVECGALGPENILEPEGLCRLLCGICGSRDPEDGDKPALVWTLPPQLDEEGAQDSYCRAALDVISVARQSIWLVSPFLEAHGVGRLVDALLLALSRNVRINVIAHDVGCLGTAASAALEDLRREAAGKPGTLTVYTVDEAAQLFVHSKIVVADTSAVLLGSANLTDRGLGINLEAGVYMHDEAAANEVLHMLTRLRKSGLVRQTFSSAAS